MTQTQAIDQNRVARECQVAARGEELLLSVQHIDIDSNTDLISEQVGVERQLAGTLGGFQCPHLRQARSDFAQKLTRRQVSGPPRSL